MDAESKTSKSTETPAAREALEESIRKAMDDALNEALRALPAEGAGERAVRGKAASAVKIPDKVFFRIGEVARIVGVKPYVLRYWESEFTLIAPQKSSTGQRVYRRADVETVLLIKQLLYGERYSIEGARKRLRELRREGELGPAKQEAVAAAQAEAQAIAQAAEVLPLPAAPLIDPERVEEMKQLARELKLMAFEPVHPLFRY